MRMRVVTEMGMLGALKNIIRYLSRATGIGLLANFKNIIRHHSWATSYAELGIYTWFGFNYRIHIMMFTD